MNFLFIRQTWKKRNQGFYKNIKQHNCFQLIIIRNVSWPPNQHIRVISVGASDTEDWSNSALQSQELILIHGNNKLLYNFKIHIKIDTCKKNSNIFHSITILTVFWSNKSLIKTALVSITDFFKKKKKKKKKLILPNPYYWPGVCMLIFFFFFFLFFKFIKVLWLFN